MWKTRICYGQVIVPLLVSPCEAYIGNLTPVLLALTSGMIYGGFIRGALISLSYSVFMAAREEGGLIWEDIVKQIVTAWHFILS